MPRNTARLNTFQLGDAVSVRAMRTPGGLTLHVPRGLYRGADARDRRSDATTFRGATRVSRGRMLFVGTVVETGEEVEADAAMLATALSLDAVSELGWPTATLDVPAALRQEFGREHAARQARTASVAAYARAQRIFREIPADVVGHSGSDAVVVMLDGGGTNRQALLDLHGDRVRPLHFEILASVALANQLLGMVLWGSCGTVFTKGFATHLGLVRRPARRVGFECCLGLLPHVLRRSIVGVYADYCGGPADASIVPLQKALAKLPRLLIVASTISLRRHPNLETNLGRYFRVPRDFVLQQTIRTHTAGAVRTPVFRRKSAALVALLGRPVLVEYEEGAFHPAIIERVERNGSGVFHVRFRGDPGNVYKMCSRGPGARSCRRI